MVNEIYSRTCGKDNKYRVVATQESNGFLVFMEVSKEKMIVGEIRIAKIEFFYWSPDREDAIECAVMEAGNRHFGDPTRDTLKEEHLDRIIPGRGQ